MIILAMEVIRNNMAARQTDLRLYLDVITEVGHFSCEYNGVPHMLSL